MVQHFFSQLAILTLTQIFALFGIFFVLGFIHSIIQTQIERTYYRALGWKGILWTAWIGTPIHELSHVFFCKLFRHRVTEITLFKPVKATGGLGHVNHSYNTKSLYQRVGNFFIGAAPMIGGSLFLWLLLSFVLPNGRAVFAPFQMVATNPSLFFEIIKTSFFTLFSAHNISTWQFWVFLYISFCVASHSAPSQEDRRGMWQGFAFIVFLIFFINLVTLFFHLPFNDIILRLPAYLSILTAIFLYTIFLSLIHCVIATIVLYPLRRK